jgi:hypothetical protein
MKKIIGIAVLVILQNTVFAQGTLETIFYRLPSEYSLDFDLAKKREEVADMKANKNHEAGSYIDEQNGYLRRVGYQCTYELCYWKNFQPDSTGISSKNLVAVIDGCQNKPDFLIEENGKFTVTKFEVFENFDARYFFKTGVKLSSIKEYLSYFSFTLPSKGYNITAHYGSLYGDQERSDLLKGDKIDFIWKDSSFVLGEAYF